MVLATVLAMLTGLVGVADSWLQVPASAWRRRAAADRSRITASAGGLIDKLRKKASRPAPPLKEVIPGSTVSSALPPGTPAPELRARVHTLLRDKPELLEGLKGAADFEFADMTPRDAEDLSDLQGEWFPEDSYPDGPPWCARLLADPGVVAIKATVPGDPDGVPAGIVVALGTRAAIEEFTGNATVQTLREKLTIPSYIPWEASSGRELGYVLSVGVVGELRRRGLAAELLRRGIDRLQAEAPDGVRAVALDLAMYNEAAIKCYEASGFRKLTVQTEAYTGVLQRRHSSLMLVRFLEEASGK